jgi:gamma-glutamylcyclotransferase (GGCT)/AIG2-like uncharacterized protein YtfP
MFAYGTLLVPDIIARLLGRVPPSEEAVLFGYRRTLLRHEPFPAVFPQLGASVSGRCYRGLGPRDVELLDDYEGELYRRVTVEVVVGGRTEQTECYVIAPGSEHLLSERDWDLDAFLLTRNLGAG